MTEITFESKVHAKLWRREGGVTKITTIKVPPTVVVTTYNGIVNSQATTDINIHDLTDDQRRAIAVGICPELADEMTRLVGELAAANQTIEFHATGKCEELMAAADAGAGQ